MRRACSFHVLLGFLLATVVFALARGRVSDPDIWGHLHHAEYLLKNHAVPRTDMLSYTVGGLPWIDFEYLAEVPYYLSWRAHGLMGIESLYLVLLELIFLGLLYLCWKESGNIKAAALACCFAAFLATVTFGPRTILFGYTYLVLLLILLQRFRQTGRAPLWLIPPLFCLWINTHGSWSLGMTVFAIVIAGGLVEGQWGKVEATRWSPSQLRRLLLTMGASIVALFINPYGYRLVLYPMDVAYHQKYSVSHILEWMSVDFHTVRGKLVIVLIVGLILAALLGRERWRLHDLGLVLFGLYAGLTYLRFLALAAILIAPLLAKLLHFLPEYEAESDKPILNAVLIAAMLVFMVRASPSSADLQKSIDRDFPAEILPYLKSHELKGPVLNSYAWGGYLCWNDRNFKAFIDSRADIFDYTGIFKDYIEFMGLHRADAVLDKYGIRYVLLSRSDQVTVLLSHEARWRTIFEGKVALLFERVGPPPKPQITTPAHGEDMRAW